MVYFLNEVGITKNTDYQTPKQQIKCGSEHKTNFSLAEKWKGVTRKAFFFFLNPWVEMGCSALNQKRRC